MAQAATQLDIKNHILSRSKVLGNSERGLKEVCSDLLNDYGRHNLKEVEKGTFLSRSTLERVMTLEEADSGEPYRPQSETLERILRYFGAEIKFDQVRISPRFRNKPKNDEQE